MSNVATLWTLNGEEVQGEVKYEHESRVVDCPSTVLQVHCCAQSPRCVLLVTRCGWQILDAMTCSIVLSQPNPVQDPLVGGEFFNSSLIAVHCRSGTTLIYRLKTRSRDHFFSIQFRVTGANDPKAALYGEQLHSMLQQTVCPNDY
ncbi:hypothetical protein P879_11212 [Paragonimus westermani]|uniref:Uncharacterized protein n=1 Tax=Paragonimus westermani TaxID=34504 RepID=A0A8T0D727_9TREM|nr:hypothetical protein P879_11212 [Paragonimus westermani]